MGVNSAKTRCAQIIAWTPRYTQVLIFSVKIRKNMNESKVRGDFEIFNFGTEPKVHESP